MGAEGLSKEDESLIISQTCSWCTARVELVLANGCCNFVMHGVQLVQRVLQLSDVIIIVGRHRLQQLRGFLQIYNESIKIPVLAWTVFPAESAMSGMV